MTENLTMTIKDAEQGKFYRNSKGAVVVFTGVDGDQPKIFNLKMGRELNCSPEYEVEEATLDQINEAIRSSNCNGLMGKITAIKGVQLPKRDNEDSRKEPKKPSKSVNLEPLKEQVLSAKSRIEEAEAKLQKFQEELLTAKTEYRESIIPYRDACRKAGINCEFSLGRKENVSERVRFITEVLDEGIKVSVKDRPETEQVLKFEDLQKNLKHW